jgi:hypothetical protein
MKDRGLAFVAVSSITFGSLTISFRRTGGETHGFASQSRDWFAFIALIKDRFASGKTGERTPDFYSAISGPRP